MNAIWRPGFVTLVALLAGCASVPSGTPPPSPAPAQAQVQPGAPRPAPNMNLSGFSVSFREGYVDGCASSRQGGQRRDERRYKSDMDYVMGWNDGFSVCRR